MKILPVLDLLNGVVVRGVAGRRETYRPVESALAPNPEPLAVARAFRETLGLDEFYLADLDAIVHERGNLGVYGELAADGFSVVVDAGLQQACEAAAILEAGAASVIAGLETLAGPEELAALSRTVGSERAVFSLDLRNGRPIGKLEPWETSEPFELARRAVEAGVRQMIVLDLAGVGVGAGVVTNELCVRIRDAFPDVRLITGGGVRGRDDLRALAGLDVDAVLVASALHSGAVGRAEIDEFRQRSTRSSDSTRSKTSG